ncbi:MAG TPA: VTT domain-containing protein [Patescibacteria group bacterium]|nr:VTT domain-containing protein [Patescibacteria group bacterium]
MKQRNQKNKTTHNPRNKRIVRISILAITIIATYFLLHSITPITYNPQLLAYVQKNELFEFIIFPLLYLLTTVIVIIPDFPLNLIGVGLFGALNTVVIIYLLSLIASCIEFLLARRFGKKVLKYVVREPAFEQVDSYIGGITEKDLWIGRILGGYFFDPISYILGATKIPLFNFLIITSIGSIPYFVLFAIASTMYPDISKLYVANEIIRYSMLTLFVIYWWKFRKNES